MRQTLALMVSFLGLEFANGQENAQSLEPVVKSKIVSVGVFKNGLALVKREILVPEHVKAFRLNSGIDAVHGSFWIEGTEYLQASLRMRDVETPVHSTPNLTLQEGLAGKNVLVILKTSQGEKNLSGTVVRADAPADEEGSAEYPVLDPYGRTIRTSEARIATQYLVLKTARGHVYLSPQDILSIETNDPDLHVKRRKPVLVFQVPQGAKSGRVFVSYLTHGLAWAPSYRIDLTNEKSLRIEMAAVLRNEMADFEDAEIQLISGFPNIEFANVASPLSVNTNLQRFFQEAANRSRGTQVEIQSQMLLNNVRTISRQPNFDLNAVPAGEGVDLHFQDAGKKSLQRGEAVSFSLASNQADYERIIEWTLDIDQNGKVKNAEKDAGTWDVLHFRNPFTFPLTTAPAQVIQNGRFGGQHLCYYTNAGEQTRVRITKALNVRASANIVLDTKRKREEVSLLHSTYFRTAFKGELAVNNHRKETVKMRIVTSLLGTLEKAEGDPTINHYVEDVSAVNPSTHMVWTFSLRPGEEKRLPFQFQSLIR